MCSSEILIYRLLKLFFTKPVCFLCSVFYVVVCHFVPALFVILLSVPWFMKQTKKNYMCSIPDGTSQSTNIDCMLPPVKFGICFERFGIHCMIHIKYKFVRENEKKQCTYGKKGQKKLQKSRFSTVQINCILSVSIY